MKEVDILIRFGKRIRTLRKQKGFSQERLALDSCLDRTYIGGVERGERNISLRNIEKLAQTLSVSISGLLKNI